MCRIKEVVKENRIYLDVTGVKSSGNLTFTTRFKMHEQDFQFLMIKEITFGILVYN